MSQGTIRRQARWDKREAKGHKTAKCDPKSWQANVDLQNQTTLNGQRYETKETVYFTVFKLYCLAEIVMNFLSQIPASSKKGTLIAPPQLGSSIIFI